MPALPNPASELRLLPVGPAAVAPVGVSSFSGGGMRATQQVQPVPGSDDVRWSRGPARPAPLLLAFELPLAQAVQSWLKFTGTLLMSRPQGALQQVDTGGKPAFELQFSDAVVTEVRLPRCDVGERIPGRLTVGLQPERVKWLGPGAAMTAPAAVVAAPARPVWNSHQFKLDIKGLDCSRVRAIEPVVVSQDAIATVDQGRFELLPGRCRCGNLVLYLPLLQAKAWLEWQAKAMELDANEERDGVLTLLASDMKTVLGTLTLYGLGLLSLQPRKDESPAAGTIELVAEMYMQRVRIDLAPK